MKKQTFCHEKIIRTFVAISLPREIVSFLKNIQDEIKRKDINASFARPETMHITLKFIGNTMKQDIETIAEAMRKTAKFHKSFLLSAGGIGIFPSKKKPGIIWAGVKGEIRRLKKMQCDLETDLDLAGFKKETKKFNPHITLARLRKSQNTSTIIQLTDDFKDHVSKSFPCPAIDLFQSELKPSGASHTKLFSIGLQ